MKHAMHSFGKQNATEQLAMSGCWRGLNHPSSCVAAWEPLRLIGLIQVASCLLVSIICLSLPVPAWSATWPLPVSGYSTSVGFHETYTAGASRFVHSGIDVPASAGMQISCPLAARVRFTGTVPSGDSRVEGSAAQTTMKAVSVEMDDGRVITLMPFDSISVTIGQVVEEGQSLGTLSAHGDVSSDAPHLHMGLKRGSTYYDPLELFGLLPANATIAEQGEPAAAAAAAANDSAGNEPAAESSVSQPAATIDSESEAADAARREEVPAETPLAVTAPVGAAHMPEVQEEPFGSISSGVRSGITLQDESSAVHPLIDALAGIVGACGEQASMLVASLGGVAHDGQVPALALVAIAVVAALGVVAAVLVVVGRIGVRLSKGLPVSFHRAFGHIRGRLAKLYREARHQQGRGYG